MGGLIITLKVKNLCAVFCVIACFCLFLFHGQDVKNAVSDTLLFCFNKLIPSVFPFMILATFVCKAGFLNYLVPKRLESILGICKNTTSIVVAAWVSGYVTGPKILNGRCGDEDATSLVFLTTNAGVGFVVSYIGISLWNSITFGLFLYFSQLLFSVLIFSFIKKPKIFLQKNEKKPLLTVFCDSVHNATLAVLEMCGFTVIVAVFSRVLCATLYLKGGISCSLIKALSEISTGSYNLCLLGVNKWSLFLVGFTLGFGGACVILQTFSACAECKINKFRFILLKFVQGIFCGFSVLIFAEFFPLTPATSVGLFKTISFSEKIAVVNAIFIFCLLNMSKNFLKMKNLY